MLFLTSSLQERSYIALRPPSRTISVPVINFDSSEAKYKNAVGIQFHPEVNLKMHLRWLYYAGYMLREKGAQKRQYQMDQRLSHGKKINMWLDSFLDNYLLRDHK